MLILPCVEGSKSLNGFHEQSVQHVEIIMYTTYFTCY